MQSPVSPISTWRPKALITPSSPAQSPLSPIVQPDESIVPFYFWNGTAWMCSFEQQAAFPFGAADKSSAPTVPFSPGSLAAHRRRPLSEPHRFSLITQNCWFSEFYQTERTRGLLAVLKQHAADFVCLQEVTATLLNLLLADPWIRDNYVVSDFSVKAISSYGTLILCRPDPERLRLYKLPSTMGRKLLVAEYTVDQHKLVIATVHLESMSHSVKSRRKQLDIIFNLLNTYFLSQASLSLRQLLPSPSGSVSSPPKIAWGTHSPGVRQSDLMSPGSRPPRHQARQRAQHSWSLAPDSTDTQREQREHKGLEAGFTFPTHWGDNSTPHGLHTGGKFNTSSSSTSMAITVSSSGARSVSDRDRSEPPSSPASRPAGLAPLQASMSSDFALSPYSNNSAHPMSPAITPAHQPHDNQANGAALPKSVSLDALRRIPTSDSVTSVFSTGSELSFPSHYQHSPSRSPAQRDNGLFSPLRSRAPAHHDAAISSSFSWSADNHHPTFHHQASFHVSHNHNETLASSPSSTSLQSSSSVPTMHNASNQTHQPSAASSSGSGNQSPLPTTVAQPVRTSSFAELISARSRQTGDTSAALWSSHATSTVVRDETMLTTPQLSPINEDKALSTSQDQLSPITQRPVHLMVRSPSSFPVSPTHVSQSQSQQSLPGGVEPSEQKVSVVLCGDFNLCHRSHENETVKSSGFLDLWPHLRPNEPGWTENTEINVMRAEKKKSRKLVRFDRVLLRSEVISQPGVNSPSGASVSGLSTQAPHMTPDHRRTWSTETAMSTSASSHLLTLPEGHERDLATSTSAASLGPTRPCVPTAIELVGTTPIAASCFDNAQTARDNIWVSDHFGLFATFALD